MLKESESALLQEKKMLGRLLVCAKYQLKMLCGLQLLKVLNRLQSFASLVIQTNTLAML